MGSLEYSIEEFLVDGIIHLQLHMTERLLKRYITVIKMRETSQSTGIYEFSIREDGISIRE
jgi:KaiC/GvpD/RAD55 family RecA-like ATPase